MYQYGTREEELQSIIDGYEWREMRRFFDSEEGRQTIEANNEMLKKCREAIKTMDNGAGI